MKNCQTEATPKSPLLSVYSKKTKKQIETATTSAASQVTRAGAHSTPGKAKPSAVVEARRGEFRFGGRFVESVAAASDPNGKRFRVTLIQEGLGNFSDCYYYTKQALASAVPLYEGAHFFVDHPSKSEEEDRPERSVNDLTGYFEKLAVEPNELGQATLTGDMVLVSGSASERVRGLIQEALQYKLKHPDKDLVGLSINASGDFEEAAIDLYLQDSGIPDVCKQKLLEAKGRGINTIRPVLAMTNAVSCDLVTAAGAGGKINQLLEGKGTMKTEKNKGKISEKKEADPSATANDKGQHADAEQDKELISQMLSKFVGDGFSDEDKAAAHEMYQEALKLHDGDEKEAQETAGRAMKMAHHMKQKASQADQPPADGAQTQTTEAGKDPVQASTTAHAGPAAAHPAHSDQVESAAGKDSNLKEIAKLQGQVAQLEAKLAERDLKEHVDTVLEESKLPRKATNKFRESIVPKIKSIKEFDERFSDFQEAFKLTEADDGLILGAEKTSGITGGEAVGLNFGDCKTE